MLHSLFTLRRHHQHFKHILSSFSLIPTTHHHFSTTITSSSPTHPSSPTSPLTFTNQNHNTQVDLSHVDFHGIAQSLLSKCSLLDNRVKERVNASSSSSSLKSHLLEVSTVIPEITRKFWRFSVLKPEHVLEILLGFQSECVRVGIQVEKVRSLWEILKWGDEKNMGFKHLLQSYEVMASLLVQVGLLREAEDLLFALEGRRISSDRHEIFDNLIEGYVERKELERAIFVYDSMKGRGMVPSRSCYRVLLDHLVQMKKTQLAFRVAFDMLDLSAPISGAEMNTLENVMILLCIYGKIQEARSMVKKVLPFNSEVSSFVFDEIAFGYCERKDFKDLLSFFVEVKCAPSVMAANRVINSLCGSYGVERAGMFMQELKSIGFSPNEVTYGILIGWSCHEGKMKNALSYLSVMLSKSFLPLIYTYNALISGLFKVGMLEHARDVLDEMIDKGTPPDISTFRVLIAGYCKSRRFDKVKNLIHEMESRGLIKLSLMENPLSKAFLILGLNPLSVRLKRDNDGRLSKTEFFDDIGNGLYLDADVDEYEKHITRVLEESVVPNFNSFVRKECSNNNPKNALVLVDEMLCWGQELLLPEFLKLVRQLCSSRSQIKSAIKLLEKMPRSAHKLDEETLNMVVQAYSKKGLLCKARIILDEMLQNNLHIKNVTYTAIFMTLCKKGNMKDLNYYWDIASRNKWIPGLEEFKHLLVHICHQKMLGEALRFLEIMLLLYPYLRLDICHVFLEVLSATGLAGIALVVLKQLQHCFILDHAGYNNLIWGLCNEGKFSPAFTVLDDMLDRNLAPCLDVSILLIPQLCKAHRFDKAISLKDIILKEQPSFSHAVHCALVCGFCNMGNIGKADTLFRDMLSKGLGPNDELCNMLIQGHCQANDSRKVGELLGVAIRKSWELSLSSYRYLVRLMCMKGRVLFALNLKNLMLAQCPLDDLIIYNILIFYLLLARNSLVVNKILSEMEEKKVVLNDVGYSYLVYGFLQCKDLSSSLHYLTTMISKGLKPRNRSLRKVISTLCDAGELQKALELSQEMRLRGWMHDSFIQTAIVENLLFCGRIQEAENFLERMEEESLIPDNINYDYLIKRFCEYGRLNKAVHLMNIMLKKHNIPISTSYDFLIHGFCVQDKLDIALDFYSEMLNWNLKPGIETVEMLVQSLCQDGRTEQAEQFLVDMIHWGETPTRKMYYTVIKSYHMEKNLRKASELMQAMQENGYQPDFEMHWSLISNLSSAKMKDTDNGSKGFLSRLLSKSGFPQKK
ncbi:pentatricopeptide repeat-containing protein At5g15280, mitochondrial [Gastrolobium bilobum]|uniref:pentatricopeptide repeat-containing protein At5g15280, mitochondrial n=1 Tax=Gastrolobium bilobum TaxID=150636 RepID=UPI002AB0631E|nr:pentatricopeptide repeat-containing protein At5g15280, mitochondrial [Gastrolobium bilobum]